MLIGRVGCYRPYRLVANNTAYTVDNIHFYKDNEILVSSQSGWLEDKNGRDIMNIDLPIEEIKLKRKIKFDGAVFIMSKGKDWSGELKAELYIPADILGVHFAENIIMFHRQVCAVYEGEQGIYISVCVKMLDSELYAVRDEYEEVYKLVSDSCLAVYNSDEVLANIDRLKELAEKYIAERKRVHNLTIDDIEI